MYGDAITDQSQLNSSKWHFPHVMSSVKREQIGKDGLVYIQAQCMYMYINFIRILMQALYTCRI